MDFKQLESFVAVVKYKSFTKAAEKLYISQPTISTHIRTLEEELNTRLLIRTTKSIEITPHGWEVYESAGSILELRNNLIEHFNSNEEKLIHIGASTIPSAYILPEILSSFGKQYPDTYFHVDQSNSQGIIDAIHHGKYDIGLVGSACCGESLACEPFYRDRMVIIAPVTEHYLAMKNSPDFSLATLLSAPVILREKGSGSEKLVETFFEEMNLKEEDLDVIARINDQESIKNLVAGGLGISFISQKAVQNYVTEKRLLSFELPDSVAERYLYLLYNKNFILKPHVQEFLQFIRGFYA